MTREEAALLGYVFQPSIDVLTNNKTTYRFGDEGLKYSDNIADELNAIFKNKKWVAEAKAIKQAGLDKAAAKQAAREAILAKGFNSIEEAIASLLK